MSVSASQELKLYQINLIHGELYSPPGYKHPLDFKENTTSGRNNIDYSICITQFHYI